VGVFFSLPARPFFKKKVGFQTLKGAKGRWLFTNMQARTDETRVVSELSSEVIAAFKDARLIALDMEGVDLSREGACLFLLDFVIRVVICCALSRPMLIDSAGGPVRREFPVLPV
jgi:hypothetical protein